MSKLAQFKSIYGARTGMSHEAAMMTRLAADISAQVGKSSMLPTSLRGSVLAIESADASARDSIMSSKENMGASITGVLGTKGYKISELAVEAASMAALMSQDLKSFLSHKDNRMHPVGRVENGTQFDYHSIVIPNHRDGMDYRGRVSLATEAFDETNNRDAVLFNITYQLGAATQNKFGETIWPTIIMDPTRNAFEVVADILTVFDRVEHKTDVALTDFAKKNLIRAQADPTILKKDANRAIPVYRAQSAAFFVPTADLTPRDTTNGEESFQTSMLRTRTNLNFIGLSQTPLQLAAGAADASYSLDPSINVDYILISVTVGADTDILKLPVKNLPYTNFTPSAQDNYRKMTLNAHSTSLVINKNTKTAAGGPLVALAAVANPANEWTLRLEFRMTGDINLETGFGYIDGRVVGVTTIVDKNNQVLSLTAAPQATVVNALANVDIEGFEAIPFKTNINRAQQGQFIDMTRYYQYYRVPLRGPITARRPASLDVTQDASDVQQLVQATRTMRANEAVTALLDQRDMIKSYYDIRDETNLGPDLLGIGRFYVRATYLSDEVDMLLTVDSLRSAQRMEDVRMGLLNRIRNMVYELWRTSEYSAASEALNGGVVTRPHVVLATDPYISQFLMQTGDPRTIATDFEFEIVDTLDYRMRGQIAVIFSSMATDRTATVDPLQFGNCLYSTEVAVTANISRGNTYTKETMVQPRYLYIGNCPIMGWLTVTNVPEVMKKVTVNMS